MSSGSCSLLASNVALAVVACLFGTSCIRSELIDYWEVRGSGKRMVDERGAPVMLRKGVGNGSGIVIERIGDGILSLRALVAQADSVKFRDATLKVVCGDSTVRVASIGRWSVRTDSAMSASSVEYSPDAKLSGARGDLADEGRRLKGGKHFYSVAQFEICAPGPFEVSFPTLEVNGQSTDLGSVTFIPQSRRITRIDPVQ